LNRALIGTGFPYQKDDLDYLIGRFGQVLKHCADLRRVGAAALDMCWVACGRLDGYYENVKIWDCAAAQLIAREAGARLGHIHPLPDSTNPQLVSSNIMIVTPALFEPLQALLRQSDASFGRH
ncbi:inositol monophosphatase family protein, partial [Gilvimarinus sp. 1_MG-2023]